MMRRRRSLKRRKRKRKRMRTREVEEVDAICVHVGGEEVEKQGEETEGVARDRHALSFGMEIRAVWTLHFLKEKIPRNGAAPFIF